MLFNSLAFETSFKTRSQIFFSKSKVFWVVKLVCGVYYGESVRIGQGLNILLNPLFIVPLNEPQYHAKLFLL
jgi:hypothetical protein